MHNGFCAMMLARCSPTPREKILLEKEGSGCKVLLANDKSDDLSRMYRLFNRLPKGLEPMAEIIKDHITEVKKARRRCSLTSGWSGYSSIEHFFFWETLLENS